MADADVAVGDAVLVNNKHRGIVRYIGSTSFADGTWFGLELEREIGKHEGTVLGVTYFTAPRKKGTFVRRENLTLYTAETEASARVQAAVRMSLAKRKARAELTWRTFNTLDADDESRILARRQRLMASALGVRLVRERPSPAQLAEWERDAEGMAVPPEYAGVHLSFPLSVEGVMSMLESFRRGHLLHYKYALRIVRDYTKYASELPTLVPVTVEPGTRLTICGDTHGQLQDLYSIFTLNGVPSPTNRYLWNGDFVDRGSYSVEIVLCLMAFCMLYPGETGTSRGAGCLLNRGNHESGNQNITGGFMSEVLDKYATAVPATGAAPGECGASGSSPTRAGGGGGEGDPSSTVSAGGGSVDDGEGGALDTELSLRLYDVFQTAFDSLPLAHLLTVDGATPSAGSSSSSAGGGGGGGRASFIGGAHGAATAASTAGGGHGPVTGTPGSTVGQMASPHFGTPSAASAATATGPGGSRGSFGGGAGSLLASSSLPRKVFVVHGGLMQHPGVTLAHVAAVKRKREIPYGFPAFEDKLYEDLMWSDPRLPNGTTPSDRGAGVFFGPDVTERFCAHNGVSLVVRSHECVPEGYQLLHDNRVLTVFSASRYCGRGNNRGAYVIFHPDLSHIVRQYVAPPLEDTAPALDPPAAISEAVAQQFEYLTAIEHGILSPHGAVTGMQHLIPAVDDSAELRQAEAVRRMLMERVVLHKSDLYYHWAQLDTAPGAPADGCITRVQWAEGMRSVLKLGLPWMSLAPILCTIDRDSGRINYSRFLDRYRIAMRDSDVAWMEGIVERACERLFQGCGTLEAAYAFFDTDRSGVIEFEELERGLLRMDIGLSRAQLVELMNALDADRDGRIQFSEFAARFRLLFSKFQDDEAAGTATSLHALTVSDSGAAPAGGSGAETPGAAGAAAPGASGRGSPSLILVDAWTREALGRVGDALFSNGGGDLQEAFKLLDSNRDGLLSPDEFTLGIHKLNLGFTEADVHRLLSAVDANHSGYINFSEFAAAFRAADVKTAPPSLRISPGASATGGYLLPPGATAAAEAGASSGGSGTPGAAAGGATLHDIRAGAGAVGEGTPGGLALPSPPHGADSPLMRFGRRGSDEDLAGAASAELSTATGRSWQQGVIEQIVATLFEYRVEMASAFRMFDTNNDGVVSREEFREGLQALAGLSASSLTDMQCDEIMRALDKDGNGVVDFAEFVGAFRIVDAEATVPVTPNINPSTGKM